MAIQLSPGVVVSEIDLTTVVPSVSTATGAFAGNFAWGPANIIKITDSENTLVSTYSAPDSNTFVSFFTAASFLSYANDLRTVRAINANTYNGTTVNPTTLVSGTGANTVIKYWVGVGKGYQADEIVYQSPDGTVANATANIQVQAYNTLTGEMAVKSNTSHGTLSMSNTIYGATSSANGTISNAPPKIQIANESVYENQYLHTGAQNLYGSFVSRYPGAIGNSIQVQVCDTSNTTAFNSWAYAGNFNSAPGTSQYVANAGGANDEFHIVVLDAGGIITGTKNTVLEVYPYVSKAYDATNDSAESIYYKNVILQKSRYVYAMDPADYANTYQTWGQSAVTTFVRTFGNSGTSSDVAAAVTRLYNAADAAVTEADLIDAYDLFANKDEVDVSFFITGGCSANVAEHILDNITTPAGSSVGRGGDSLVFISPPKDAVVDNAGSEVADITTWLANFNSSSYAVMDSGWKYMFDKYNNVYRWIPLNGDVAGLCAFTDQVRDPWYSPAGFNRGAVKNVVKLAWNPNQTARDILYPQGVNPIVSFPGNGVVLYGDKTYQTKPSAFDRINVRRLFIVLEKAIARAAKYSLFEFNDEFTRAQFVALVTPYLRQVQGRRGIYDFRVVCDTTNNTPFVIDSNQFVGDIYIKPARSINFIKLNFIAVGTGVQFSEVAGAA